MSSREDDDLFGDGDSGDSLFGDDNDSLFDGPDDDQAEQTTSSNSSSSCSSNTEPVTAAPALGFLSLPSVPDPHDALSCDHAGLTSGQHTVSTQDPSGNVWGLSLPEPTDFGASIDAQVFREQAIDTFPVASHYNGDQAGHEPQVQTTHVSSQPSVSKEGDMRDTVMMLEAEFALDQQGSEQLDQGPAPTLAYPYAAPTPNDTPLVDEYNRLYPQAARTTTTACGDPPETIGIDLATAGFRWADAQTRRGIRLPRRIDFDGADVSVLKPYVSFNRGDTMSLHYQRLELPEKTGVLLVKELRMHIRLSPLPEVQLLTQKGTLGIDRRRAMYLNVALRLLRYEGWGTKWFGSASPGGRTRKHLWPSDSTVIVMRFACLLYKIFDQAKYWKTGPQGRQQSIESQQTLEGLSQASPIDLTNDDFSTAGDIHGLTPSPSVISSLPDSSQILMNQAAPSNGAALSDQDSMSFPRRTSLGAPTAPLPVYKSPAFDIPVSAADFWISQGSAPTSTSIAQSAENQAVSPALEGITFATLAEEVASAKQQKQQPAAIQPVKYNLTFTDSTDQQALRPPIEGLIAEEIVRKDKLVETIQSTFARAGVPPTITIDVNQGPAEVRTQQEWNEGVQTVWQQHGDGAMVNVNIRV